MPGKSRHSKERRSLQRKIRSRQHPGASAAQQSVVTQPTKLAAPAATTAPSTRGQARSATATVTSYPYIAGELLRIGILTGVILVILIVLALIYS